MKIGLNLEFFICVIVVVLSLAALALVVVSPGQFNSAKAVYQGF
jgi:hypothetical protein